MIPLTHYYYPHENALDPPIKSPLLNWSSWILLILNPSKKSSTQETHLQMRDKDMEMSLILLKAMTVITLPYIPLMDLPSQSPSYNTLPPLLDDDDKEMVLEVKAQIPVNFNGKNEDAA